MPNELQVEFLTNWIAALRSGKYKQGFCGLHKRGPKGEDTYCVLGVGCDTAMKMGYGHWVRLEGNSDNAFEYDGEIQYCFPPDKLMKVFGLECNPVLIHGHIRTYMAVLNNFDKVTFKQFADLLERQRLPIARGIRVKLEE